MTDPAFRDAIRSRREEIGLSKRKAAEISGMSEALWRQIEVGYRQVTHDVRVPVHPSAGRVRSMARALGMPASDLLVLAGFEPTAADDAHVEGPDATIEAILADTTLQPEAKAHFLNQLRLLRKLGAGRPMSGPEADALGEALLEATEDPEPAPRPPKPEQPPSDEQSPSVDE